MEKEKLIMLIEDFNQEQQFIIGTDEDVENDYADGYQQAINDILDLINKNF